MNKTQTNIQDEFDMQFPEKEQTQQQYGISQLKSQAKKSIQQGNYGPMENLIKQGVYTTSGAKTVIREQLKQKMYGGDQYTQMFSDLPAANQIQLYQEMSTADQNKYRPFLTKKAFQLLRESQQ